MFGFCAFRFVIFIFICSTTIASLAASQWGTIVVDEAMVFKDPDFDSDMIAQVHRGEVFVMGTQPQGPFYKIKLKDGRLGWVMDVDIKPGKNSSTQTTVKKNEKKTKNNIVQNSDKSKSPAKVIFGAQRWRGLHYELIQFTEKTMGKKYSESLGFLGLRIAGPNTVADGDTFVTTDVLFYFDAPKYYDQVTGQKADGWIMLTQFLFQTLYAQASQYYSMIGFGPLFKYSHFNLSLDRSGKIYNYSADDMYLGFVLQGGVAARLNPSLSLRLDAKYYYEKQQYFSGGFSLMGSF